MKSEIPGARGTTGDGGGPPEYDPLNDSSGSDSDDSDSGPNTESLTGSDEFVRAGMSSMDESMMESGGHQDDRRNESEAHQSEDDERNIVSSKPGRGHPAAAGNAEDTDGGATASGMTHSALDQVTQKLGSFVPESGKGSSKVEGSIQDGHVRGSEVGKGLIQRPNSLATIKVSEGPSSAGIAAASLGVSKVEARSEQSARSKVHMDTIPSRPAITAVTVGQISERSSRQSMKHVIPSSANTYNPLADSSQSSSSSNSPDACDHDKIADFSDKMKSEPSSSAVMEASLVAVSKTLNHSEDQTDPSPPPATTVSAAIDTSSTPEISTSSENTSKSGTKTLHLSSSKLQQNPLRSVSLVKTQMSSSESSPEVFSAQELPQKNHQSYMSVTGDRKLEYAGRRFSGPEGTPSGIGPVGLEDLSKPTELGTRDTERLTSTSSNECLSKSTAAAPAVARRTSRFREKLMQKGGILYQKIKPSPSAPLAVHEVSSPTKNPKTGAHVLFESSASVEPKDIQPEEWVRKSNFSTSAPPAIPALEPIQQCKSEQQAPVQNSAPIHPSRPVEFAASPPDPDQAIQIYTDGAKRHLQNLSIADIVDENESGFKFYCKAWFEAIVHERQWQQINFTMIPSETVEKVVAAYETLRSHVIRIEDIFESCICLPPVQISQQVSLQYLKGLNQLLPDFKELVENQAKQFAEHYEKRNKEIIQLEGQVIGALIQMCGKYFEEEALYQMGNNYFESEPLSVLLKPIEQETRKHFLNVCVFKIAIWTQKYTNVFNEKIEQRMSNVKAINEQRRMKTQTEINEVIDKALQKYTEELVEILKKPTGYTYYKRQMPYRVVPSNLQAEVSNKVKVELMRKWGSCPSMYDKALKDFEERVTQINNDQSKKLTEQKSSESYGHQGAISQGPTTRSRANTQSREKATNPAAKPSDDPLSTHGASAGVRKTTQQNSNVNSTRTGENATNPCFKPPEDPLSMFKDLPVSTIAIHMGLSSTVMGLFRPGTKEFVNLGRVEHMLYYHDDSILLAYDDADREKLGQPDFDFRGLIVKGPVDELVDVDLGGDKFAVRKEQIFSSFLAALKWKAELLTKMKLRDCVIVVPQFLNMPQRDCIGDAAKMAGFLDVKFTDDTTAIALRYMLWNKTKSLSMIAISGLEGPLDIARFTMKDGIVRRHEISGSNFMKTEQAKNFVSRALNATWTLVYGATTKEGNEIEKMFSFKEFEVGAGTVEHEVKVFVGNDEDFENVKAALFYPKNLIKFPEVTALTGGAFMASICKWDCLCPIFKTWDSLYTGSGKRSTSSYQEFERELLATKFKEKKRASNIPSPKTVPLSKEDIEKIMNFLKNGVEVHDVAMNAVKVFRVIEEAIARKRLCSNAQSDVLSSLINSHLCELRQPNRRIEEAKRILDELLDTWREHVRGQSTPSSVQK